MWHKEKNKNPIVNLTLLLALASTPVMSSFLKSDYVLAQSATETPSFPLPTAVPDGTTIRVDGSASMTRANEALKQRFENKYSGTNVELASNGTDDALQALQDGKIDIAAIGRGLTPEEKKQGLTQQRLRREKIAIVVGRDNPFKGDLSNQQFTRIYRGEITNWSQLGGPPGKIRVIDRPDTSDTREAFRNYPLFKGDLFRTGSTATQLDSDDPAEVVNQLGNDGIGFVLANQVSKLDNKVRILSMHKTLPDDPRYPYSQPLVYVFKQNPPEAVKNFVGFATAAPGKEAIEEAREKEAAAVAQTVAQAISGDGNAATATPEATTAATPTTGSTESATTDAQTATADNETATTDGTATLGSTETATTDGTPDSSVGTATNTSASGSDATGEQALVPGTSAGVSAEAAGTTIPWWWILLPVAVIGALILWWLLGRRKSQEDDTVARGVLPDDAPPPFTPTSTNTSGAVPEPVANQPIDTASNATPGTVGMNAAPVETAANTTPGMNAAGIAAGVAGLGLGAAALSSKDREDTSDVSENSTVDPDSELPLDAPDLQQPDVSNVEAPDLEQPDIPDTSLDLEAPAAVVNTSYPPLPLISNPTDEEAPPTEEGDAASAQLETSPQEELPSPGGNNWLGNFAIGSAAAAGAAKIKSKLASREASESAADESVSEAQLKEVEKKTEYPPLPDVWEAEKSPTDEPKDSSALGAAAGLASGLFNTGNDDTSDDDRNSVENLAVEQPTVVQETTPSQLWETPPETEAQSTEVQENSSFPLSGAAAAAAGLASGLFNKGNDDISDDDRNSVENQVKEQPTVAQETTPSDLWGTPETEEQGADVQENSSFPLGGVAAAAAGLAGGAAALGSGLFNRDKDDTSDDSNNPEEKVVEEQPTAAQETTASDLWGTPETEQSPTDAQRNVPGYGGFATAEFLNRSQQNTPGTSDRTQASSVSNADLPEVRITTSNEQSEVAVGASPQEPSPNDGLPNVWVTPSNSQSRNPEETVSEKQVAQFGISSKLEDDPASTSGAVLAGGAALGAAGLASQVLGGSNEASQDADEERAAVDVALDKVADEAEADTNISTSELSSDARDSSGNSIYGIRSNRDANESYVLLANRTPKWAYASWNIATDARVAMQNRGATQLVLRLYDVTDIDLSYQEPRIIQQYECEETVAHRYVAIPTNDRDYIAEIGYLTGDKEWLRVSRSPVIRVFSRPHKDFWFEADAELIIHGATEPGSTVTIGGQNIKVKQDGTFHLRVPFTESLIDYLITAVAPDSEQAKTIHLQFEQSEPKSS